jgi:hypothetical protein
MSSPRLVSQHRPKKSFQPDFPSIYKTAALIVSSRGKKLTRRIFSLLVSVCGAIALIVAYSEVCDEIPKFHLSHNTVQQVGGILNRHGHFKHTLRAQRCRECGRWTLPCHTVPISHGSTAISEKKNPCMFTGLVSLLSEHPSYICQSLRFLCSTVLGGTSSVLERCRRVLIGRYVLRAEVFHYPRLQRRVPCVLISGDPAVGLSVGRRSPRRCAVAAKECNNLAPPRLPQTHGRRRKECQVTHKTFQPPSAGASLELQGQLLRPPDGWDVLLHFCVPVEIDIMEAASLAGMNSSAIGIITLSTDQSARDSNWRSLGSSSQTAYRSHPASWCSTPGSWMVIVSVQRSFAPRDFLSRTISSSNAYSHDSECAIFLNIGAKAAGKIMRVHSPWAPLIQKKSCSNRFRGSVHISESRSRKS